MVIMFGDDYQLMPVQNNSAINGYAKILGQIADYRLDKIIKAQYYSYHRDWLFSKG